MAIVGTGILNNYHLRTRKACNSQLTTHVGQQLRMLPLPKHIPLKTALATCFQNCSMQAAHNSQHGENAVNDGKRSSLAVLSRLHAYRMDAFSIHRLHKSDQQEGQRRVGRSWAQNVCKLSRESCYYFFRITTTMSISITITPPPTTTAATATATATPIPPLLLLLLLLRLLLLRLMKAFHQSQLKLLEVMQQDHGPRRALGHHLGTQKPRTSWVQLN